MIHAPQPAKTVGCTCDKIAAVPQGRQDAVNLPALRIDIADTFISAKTRLQLVK